MKVHQDKYREVCHMFPQLEPLLQKLDSGNITYIIGGSLALFVQGNARKPHDIDIMFPGDAHDEANKLFNLQKEHIERPNVTMDKSTPVTDGSVDFLSNYTVIANGRVYKNPPQHKVPLEVDGRTRNFVPAEKIAVFKIIGRRSHHQDIDDVKALLEHPDFDGAKFMELVELFDAKEVVTSLIAENNLKLNVQ